MEPKVTQGLQALGFFKDWTNYLLVTTVAALGWIATKPVVGFPPWLLALTIACFGLSIVCAILTLALIPIVAEKYESKTTSIYDVDAPFKTFWLWGKTKHSRLKVPCWPQHVFFLAGIILFCVEHHWCHQFSSSASIAPTEPVPRGTGNEDAGIT